jgi:hypothetical protein
MSQAEQLVQHWRKGRKLPKAIAAAAAEVAEVAARNAQAAIAAHEEAPAVRRGLERALAQERISHEEFRHRIGDLLEDAEYVTDYLANQTYAYRFEQLQDGSVVALYVTQHEREVELAAFPSLRATRGWHPVKAPLEGQTS